MRSLAIPALCLLLLSAHPARAAEYFVSLTGNDTTGDGSATKPWRSIAHAVNVGVPAGGGDSVVVEDGTYEGNTTLSRGFPLPVTVRAKSSLRVKLTNVSGTNEVLRIYVNGSANLVIDGFLMTNLDPTYTCTQREQYFIVHVQDASDVTIQNNVIFGNAAKGRCNELLKVNRGNDTAYPKNIVIRGNVLYDHVNAGGADMIDSVRPGELEIVDNIFWGDPTKTQAQSFITLKRQAPVVGTAASPRFHVHRNVFLNWGGKSDQAFVQLGEDGVDFAEITDALLENNLMIGNSPATMAAPFQLKGAQNVEVRANTVVGDLPSGAFGARIGTEGSNPAVSGFFFRNNVFSDPGGSMGNRLLNVYGQAVASSIVLESSLFFNAGAALPTQGAVLPSADTSALVADPKLPSNQTNIVMPEWDEAAAAFKSGSTTIREEFLRLVESYGALGDGSAAIDSADPKSMPGDDIRGLARDGLPDRGAYERGASTPAPDAGVGGSTSTGGSAGTGAVSSAGAGGGSSGTGSAGTGAAAAVGGATGSAASDDGGCGCRAKPRSSTETGLLLLALLVLFGRQARRRPSAPGRHAAR